MKRKENEEIEDIIKPEDIYTNDFYFRVLNKDRYILLYDEISNVSAELVCTKLRTMNLLNSKKPIWLEINSPGGSVVDGFAIIDTIHAINAPVYTIINGEAASMAAMVSISGDKRYITENACFMQHSTSDLIGGFFEHIKNRVSFLVRLEKRMDNIIKQKTKLTHKQLNIIKNGELWLDAEEALKFGVVDNIIKPIKKG